MALAQSLEQAHKALGGVVAQAHDAGRLDACGTMHRDMQGLPAATLAPLSLPPLAPCRLSSWPFSWHLPRIL